MTIGSPRKIVPERREILKKGFVFFGSREEIPRDIAKKLVTAAKELRKKAKV
jgi:hypothetical protein